MGSEEIDYISGCLFNPYGMRVCYPAYFGDLNLDIKKGFGTYCQGEVEKRNFCLTFFINNCLELVDVYTAGKCNEFWSAYGEPITGYGTVVGAKLTYVLGSTGEYVVVYARYDTPSPYGHGPTVIDEARRGVYPMNAVIKRFKVIDPDHAEVLDTWTCSGYECRNIEDAFRKICTGEKVNTSTSHVTQPTNIEEHKESEATSQQTFTIASWSYPSFFYFIFFPFYHYLRRKTNISK